VVFIKKLLADTQQILLSMNEVNILLSMNEHIFFIDFLDELELLIGEKPIFQTKKKYVALPSAVIS
jgi:hypothetical protein